MPKANRGKVTPSTSPIKQPHWPASKLLIQADSLFDKFEFETCLSFAERALTCSSDATEDKTRAYQLITACLLEMGELGQARKQFLNMLTQVEEGARVEALFSLGQLSEGKEALSFYLQGIQESTNNDLVSNAWSSIAELYMTDLCEEDEAEQACEDAISKALEHGSAEAHRVAAELRLVQGKHDEAKRHAEQLVGMPGHTSYDCRLAITKIFIELQMYPEAISFAEALLQEDDEVLDVWYLLAFTCKQAGMTSECLDALEGGLTLVEKLKQVCIEYDAEMETELINMKTKLYVEDDGNIDTPTPDGQECSSEMSEGR